MISQHADFENYALTGVWSFHFLERVYTDFRTKLGPRRDAIEVFNLRR